MIILNVFRSLEYLYLISLSEKETLILMQNYSSKYRNIKEKRSVAYIVVTLSRRNVGRQT